MDRVLFAAFGVIAVVYGTLSAKRAAIYQQEITLWEAAVANDDRDATAHCWLAIMLARDGMTDAAMEHYHRSIALNPHSPFARNNLGIMLMDLGRPTEAIEHFEEFVRLQRESALGYFNLGNALLKSGRSAEGYQSLVMALERNPQFLKAQFNLAIAHAILRRPQEAIATAERAIQMARSQHKPNAEQQITQWLTDYKASLSPVAH
jgi:tetratricopeptide (TPR) repeat protein